MCPRPRGSRGSGGRRRPRSSARGPVRERSAGRGRRCGPPIHAATGAAGSPRAPGASSRTGLRFGLGDGRGSSRCSRHSPVSMDRHANVPTPALLRRAERQLAVPPTYQRPGAPRDHGSARRSLRRRNRRDPSDALEQSARTCGHGRDPRTRRAVRRCPDGTGIVGCRPGQHAVRDSQGESRHATHSPIVTSRGRGARREPPPCRRRGLAAAARAHRHRLRLRRRQGGRQADSASAAATDDGDGKITIPDELKDKLKEHGIDLDKWKNGAWKNWDKDDWLREAEDFVNPVIEGLWDTGPDAGRRRPDRRASTRTTSRATRASPTRRRAGQRQAGDAAVPRQRARGGQGVLRRPRGLDGLLGDRGEGPAPTPASPTWCGPRATACTRARRAAGTATSSSCPSYNDAGKSSRRAGERPAQEVAPYGVWWADWAADLRPVDRAGRSDRRRRAPRTTSRSCM